MNAAGIRTYAVLGILVVVFALAGFYLADQNGYNRATSKYNTLAATASQKAKKKQAVEQASVNQLGTLYYNAMETSHELNKELDAYKAQLRTERTIDEKPTNECDCSTKTPVRPVWPVYPAIYRMYNRSVRHPDLIPDQRTRTIDGVGDGLDAIQHCGTEESRLKIKVNSLQGVIRKASSCFIFPEK